MLWLIWLVWSERLQCAGAGVGGSVVVPFSVSISEAFKLVLSDIVISMLSKWISPSIDLHKSINSLGSDIIFWLVWLVWSQVVFLA